MCFVLFCNDHINNNLALRFLEQRMTETNTKLRIRADCYPYVLSVIGIPKCSTILDIQTTLMVAVYPGLAVHVRSKISDLLLQYLSLSIAVLVHEYWCARMVCTVVLDRRQYCNNSITSR